MASLSRGEQGLLDEIRSRFGRLAPASPRGIGDDAALLAAVRGRPLLTTDCLIEGIHFRRNEPFHLLGRKSLAVNLSDIAAMGGIPSAFLLTLGIPRDLPSGDLSAFLDGLASSAREFVVPIAGGDISRSPGPLTISITVLGRAGRPPRAALTRGGAKAGDGIYVSGPLGASAAGRRLLETGWRPRLGAGGRSIVGATAPEKARSRRPGRTQAPAEALRAHLDPRPRLGLGQTLLRRGIASAAIDLSDGLSLDLARLADASRIGARLLAPAMPIADAARDLGALLRVDPLDLALHGGEDYELLFTVPPRREGLLAGLPAILIGRVTPRRNGLILANSAGRGRRLAPQGHDHLR